MQVLGNEIVKEQKLTIGVDRELHSVNAARGLVKSYGERLRKCGTEQFRRETTSGKSVSCGFGLRYGQIGGGWVDQGASSEVLLPPPFSRKLFEDFF